MTKDDDRDRGKEGRKPTDTQYCKGTISLLELFFLCGLPTTTSDENAERRKKAKPTTKRSFSTLRNRESARQDSLSLFSLLCSAAMRAGEDCVHGILLHYGWGYTVNLHVTTLTIFAGNVWTFLPCCSFSLSLSTTTKQRRRNGVRGRPSSERRWRVKQQSNNRRRGPRCFHRIFLTSCIYI